jgi:hypothetical protein
MLDEGNLVGNNFELYLYVYETVLLTSCFSFTGQ